jgi:hypothetical protein
MEKLKSPASMGKKIHGLLKKNKILLLQDKVFPSIVTELIGKKIVGSWWGHPLANPIYNGLMWLEHNQPILIVKLIDGKVTYLHESLTPDLFSIVKEPQAWQLNKLKDDELKLFKYIAKKKRITSDDESLKKLVVNPKKSLTVLEKKLLVFSAEEHTESGKHMKKYMTWDFSPYSVTDPKDALMSQRKIEEIVAGLCEISGAKVKLPW